MSCNRQTQIYFANYGELYEESIMLLNHIWGLYAHPKEEWQTIEKRHESLTSVSYTHLTLPTSR